MQFVDGWLVHYNYFRPHEALKDETPAQEANIQYEFKNWRVVTWLPAVSEHKRVSRYKTPRIT